MHVHGVFGGHRKCRSSSKTLPAAKCGRQEWRQVINVAVLVLGDSLLSCCKSRSRSWRCRQKYQGIWELGSVRGFWQGVYKCSKSLIFCNSGLWRPSVITGAHPALGYGVSSALGFPLLSCLHQLALLKPVPIA